MAARLKAYPDQDGFEICGNREGLRRLAEICLLLADLPETSEEAKRIGNHYHFGEHMDDAVKPGSTPFVLLYDPDL